MEGTTACDGQPEERPKADIKDFDKDMNTIQEWNSANAANIESFWEGPWIPIRRQSSQTAWMRSAT